MKIASFFSGIVFFLIFFLNISVFAKAPNCPWEWTNPKTNKKEARTATPRPYYKYNHQTDAETIHYEPCEKAVNRARHSENEKFALGHAQSSFMKGVSGGSYDGSRPKHPCTWTPPELPGHTNPKPITATQRKIGLNEDGSPRYESCTSAAKRTQKKWMNNNFSGHREDAERLIKQRNEERMSASKKAKRNASNKQMGGMLAIGGAAWAGYKAFTCCTSTTPCGCPWWVALTTGLAGAGVGLMKSANQSNKVADAYSKGTTLEFGADADGGTNTGGDITIPGGNIPGEGGPGDLKTPLVTVTGVGPMRLTPDDLKNVLAKKGMTLNPEKKTLTMPDGTVHTADPNMDTSQFANSPQGKAINNQMQAMQASLKKQLEDSYGDDEVAGSGNAFGDDDDEMGGGGGGGGFAGYGGGSNTGGGAGYGRQVAALGIPKKTGADDDNASKVAGMSVNAGSNKVGVSQDNIFKMIHRKFQKKRKQKQFIEIGQ